MSIFSITAGSCRLRHPASPYLLRASTRMRAMPLTAPPHSRQVWMSMLNTRLSACTQIMAALGSWEERILRGMTVVPCRPCIPMEGLQRIDPSTFEKLSWSWSNKEGTGQNTSSPDEEKAR